MYQLDEKVMSEERAIIAISRNKAGVDPDLRLGMIAFEQENKNAYVVAAKDSLHRIIKEEKDGKIHGQIVFADDVVIENNLIIRGETTKVETVDMVVSDNVIEINKDETGAGVSRGVAGFMINRGTSPMYHSVFNEKTDRSSLGGYTHAIGNTQLATLYSNGDVWTKGNIDTQNIFVNKSVVINETLLTKGDATINGIVTVQGETSFNSPVHMSSTLDVSKNAAVGGTLTVMDTSIFKKNSDFKQSITVDLDAAVGRNLSVTGNTTFSGTVAINSPTTLQKLIVTNTSTFNGVVTANAVSTFNEDVTLKKNASVGANFSVAGETTLKNILINNKLQVEGASVLNGAFTVKGLSTLNGAFKATNSAELGSTLSVAGAATFNSTLSALKSSASFKEISVNENVNVLGKVTTNEVITKSLNVSGQSAFSQKVTMTSDLDITGNISGKGTTTLNHLTVGGTTTINGKADFNADTNFKNNVNVTKQLNVVGDTMASNLNVSAALSFSPLKKANMILKAFDSANSLFGVASDSLASNVLMGTTYKNYVANTLITELSKEAFRSTVPIQVKSGGRWGTVLDDVTGHKALHGMGGSDEIAPKDIGAIKNQTGLYQIGKGLDSKKGMPHAEGALYAATDTRTIYASINNVWERMAAVTWSDIAGKPGSFAPVIATGNRLGGIKVGKNLAIEEDGTLSAPNASIEYTIHRKEFITQSAGVTTFKTDVEFVTGCNMTSVYVFGKLLPPSAYTEKDGRTIVLKQPVALQSHVEIIALIVPSKAMFSFKREEFYAKPYQKRFTLFRGKYLVGEDKLKVYLFGSLLPKSAYKEIDNTTIELTRSLSEGDQVTFEYFSAQELSSRLTTAKVASYSAKSKELVFEFAEAKEVWTLKHNMNTYPAVTVIAYNGLKLEPIGTVYSDQNTIHLTFASPVAGRVFIK